MHLVAEMLKLVSTNNSTLNVRKLILWYELTMHITLSLSLTECDEYYGLTSQFTTVPFRQYLNPVFEPYKDILISTTRTIVE